MGMMTRNFTQIQKDRFRRAEADKFYWRTENSYVCRKEQELLLGLLNAGDQNILEVGCGEGASLANLKKICDYQCNLVGIDYSYNKVAFANQEVRAIFLCADAVSLPFGSDTFDLVFAKDLLHHLNPDQQRAAITEMFRVCRKGGRVVFIEENGRFNLFMLFFSLIARHERGGLKISRDKILTAIYQTGCTKDVSVKMLEPSSFFRVLLHYRYGARRWSRLIEPVIAVIDRIVGWVNVEKCYGYIFAEAIKGV